MKRAVLLLLGAGLVVWAALLFDPAAPTARRSAGAAQETAEGTKTAATTTVDTAVKSAAPPVGPGDTTGSDAPRRADARSSIVQRMHARRASHEEIGAERGPPEASGSERHVGMQTEVAKLAATTPPQPQIGEAVYAGPAEGKGALPEQGEGVLSEDFRELERDYMNEPRAGDWAHAHEHALRQVLRDAEFMSKTVLVNCREATCRLVMREMEVADVEALLRTPALLEHTALSPDAPYSLRGGQLSLYFRPGDGAP